MSRHTREPKYNKPLLYALGVHALVAALLIINISLSSETLKMPAIAPKIDVIESTVVSEKSIEAEIKRIAQKENQETERLEAEKARLQALAEKAKQEREAEEAKAEEIRQSIEQAKIEEAKQQKEKQAAEQLLAKVQAEKKAEEARLEKVKVQREKEVKAAELAKAEAKTKAEAKKLAEKKKAEEKKIEEAKLEKTKQDNIKKEAELKKQALAKKDASERAKREALLQESLMAEGEHVKIEDELARFTALIMAKVNQNWAKPLGVPEGLSCTVMVSILPDGEVIDAVVAASSGNVAFDRSSELAVRKSSPLPVPTDANVLKQFRRFKFIFKPDV